MKRLFIALAFVCISINVCAQSIGTISTEARSWRGKYEASLGLGFIPNVNANLFLGATNGYNTIGLHSGMTIGILGIMYVPIIPQYRHYFLDQSLTTRPYAEGGIGVNLYINPSEPRVLPTAKLGAGFQWKHLIVGVDVSYFIEYLTAINLKVGVSF